MKQEANGTLGLLLKRGKIDRAAYEAGVRFGDEFNAARLNGISARDYSENTNACHGTTSATERAICGSQSVSQALDALGGMACPCAKAAWSMIGLEQPISLWANDEGYDKMEAKGILLSALYLLSRYYRYC